MTTKQRPVDRIFWNDHARTHHLSYIGAGYAALCGWKSRTTKLSTSPRR